MGGELIGRAITDRPDLFVAASIQVGMVNPPDHRQEWLDPVRRGR